MPHLKITTQSGDSKMINAAGDLSLMEVIRENGFDELLALCGGSCSCATCQVYIDPEFFGRLPPMSQDEAELLDNSGVRKGNSRLSCQIRVAQELEGMVVTIAPKDPDA
jgi:2Fe-2S ferredoxin